VNAFTRDAHWLDKLYQLICESPDISLDRLKQKTRKLTDAERQAYLGRLKAQGKINWVGRDAPYGKVTWHFRRFEKTAESLTDCLASTMAEAKRLMAELTVCLETATCIVNEMAAETAAPIVEARGQDYKTATLPAGEIRSAC
jgi:hypothetical protein